MLGDPLAGDNTQETQLSAHRRGGVIPEKQDKSKTVLWGVGVPVHRAVSGKVRSHSDNKTSAVAKAISNLTTNLVEHVTGIARGCSGFYHPSGTVFDCREIRLDRY